MFYRLVPDIGLYANTLGANDSGYWGRYEEMWRKKIILEIYSGSSVTQKHNDFFSDTAEESFQQKCPLSSEDGPFNTLDRKLILIQTGQIYNFLGASIGPDQEAEIWGLFCQRN